MAEKRKHPRSRKYQADDLKITWNDRPGRPARVLTARLLDAANGGLGVETAEPVAVGTAVSVSGNVRNGESSVALNGRARVADCLASNGGFRIGLVFGEPGRQKPSSEDQNHREGASASGSFVDYYEVLQLSPNADPEMIHRIYRLLAQRYHPDNQETGNEETFKTLLKAYRVLVDPEQRAAYDMKHQSARKLRWKIFDQSSASHNIEGEKRKRHGILSLLYHKRMRQPDQPHITLFELEDLLGCPREHLEFTLWYLKEQGWVGRSDNGQHFITARGVEAAETSTVSHEQEGRLLTVAQPTR